MDVDRSPTNVRVVPDLGDELLVVIDRLGALLGSVAIWEREDDVGLPAPFADGKALGALQAVAEVVRPTQGRGEPQLVSGRLSVAAGSAAGCRCTLCRYPTRRSRRWSMPCRSSPCSGPTPTSTSR